MMKKIRQNLSKKEIANNINSIIGFSTKNIQKITDEIIDAVIHALIDQRKLNIKNFGTFYIIYKNQREGRNPLTKEEFTITSRNIVKFKASDLLKRKINDI